MTYTPMKTAHAPASNSFRNRFYDDSIGMRFRPGAAAERVPHAQSRRLFGTGTTPALGVFIDPRPRATSLFESREYVQAQHEIVSVLIRPERL